MLNYKCLLSLLTSKINNKNMSQYLFIDFFFKIKHIKNSSFF